eukprot:CAMPEP_0181431700 /NCGR_PEP_ID=MMETSP1110-20121109/18387_1 /TAXON_ID=174948 /ORGANISM="Symbiodinium sp., Strain CCMP421" /LENGTH=731 /DNA_ID=CAMNT_0023555081 /DNA_START=20 /DNA_END=2211 /DNA_ORIENTATION=+
MADVDECTMAQACWASLTLALLEKDCPSREQETRVEEQGVDDTADDASDCMSPVTSKDHTAGEHQEQDGEGKETHSPKAKNPVSPGEESFLSETTAPNYRFRGSPIMDDSADHSFQTDMRAFHTPNVKDCLRTPPLDQEQGCASTFASVAAADFARQHLEWVQEMEMVDQKQVDVMTTQWRLLRSQTGMLAQQLIDMRKELDLLRSEQQRAAARWETQSYQGRELQHRLATTLQQSVEETHMSLARMRTEVQKRTSQDSDMMRRLQSLESWTAAELPKLECEVSELRSAVDVSAKHTVLLRDQMLQQVDDLKSGHVVAMEHSTKQHDRMRKGLRALMTAHESHRNEVQHMQQTWQDSISQKLENLHEAQQHLAETVPAKEDGNLQNRLDDLEAMVDGFDGKAQGLKQTCAEIDAKCQELEKSNKWMGATLSQEVHARHSMTEVFEQMLKTEAAKIASSVSDQAAVAHLDCKDTQKTIMDHLSKETTERQEQARAINCDLASLGNGLGGRLGRLEGAWQGVHQDWRDTEHTFQMVQGQLHQLESCLETGLKGLRAEMHSSFREERLKREVNGNSMAERMQAWEDFHKHLRQWYVAHADPPRDGRLRDSDMNMERLAEMLRCSQDADWRGRLGEVPDILRGSENFDALKSGQDAELFQTKRFAILLNSVCKGVRAAWMVGSANLGQEARKPCSALGVGRRSALVTGMPDDRRLGTRQHSFYDTAPPACCSAVG